MSAITEVPMTAIRLMSVTFLAGALLTATARAADAPTTKPAAASTQGSVSSQAKAELEKVNAAYIGLNSLDLSGKITAHFDIAGQKQNQESEFTSIYLAPNKFRQQVKGDVLAGSTGEKLYLFSSDDNKYLTQAAPKGKAGRGDFQQR